MQAEWKAVPGTQIEAPVVDSRGRAGRIDVCVRASEPTAVIEIKRTDWNRVREQRVRANALRHARQLWRYVEAHLAGGDVAPAIIYERVPRAPARCAAIEAVLHDRLIQVVWQREPVEACRRRLLGSYR